MKMFEGQSETELKTQNNGSSENLIETMLYREVPGRLPSRLRLALCSLWSYRQRHGSWPNIITPKTFHENLQRRKIFDTNPLFPLLADKLLMKDYVREYLGDGWLNPTLWSGERLPPHAERNWPVPFVIKANHGSGWNRFVLTKEDLDWPSIEASCERWMRSYFGTRTGEWHYTRIKPMLLVEPFIGTAGVKPADYKLFCFNGKVRFTQVVTNRDSDIRLTMYDPDWKRYEAVDSTYRTADADSTRPLAYDQMKEAAEILTRGIDFVRVDFYEIDGSPRLGELTFYPGAGQDPFRPPEFDQMVVRMFNEH